MSLLYPEILLQNIERQSVAKIFSKKCRNCNVTWNCCEDENNNEGQLIAVDIVSLFLSSK